MNAEQVKALSDDELVIAVARALFDWPHEDMRPLCYDLISQACRNATPDRQEPWAPLLCWDHAMMVMQAMREKGFCALLFQGVKDDPFTAEFWLTGKIQNTVRCANSNDRRAVCEAALIALE